MSNRHRRRRHTRSPLGICALCLLAAALLAIIAARANTTEQPRAGRPELAPLVSNHTEPTERPQSRPQATPDADQQMTQPDAVDAADDNTAAENTESWEPDEAEVAYIAKTIYGEASVVRSKARQAAVGWCILNRVDSPDFPDTVAEVVSAPYQFHGYHESSTPPEEYFELARDILTRYHREQQGEAEVGRTLPQGWCYFFGDGKENYFTEEWRGSPSWSWTLPDPYAEEDWE